MTSRAHIKLLQGMPFFGAITEESIELILSLSEMVSIRQDMFFYHQDEPGDCLFVLETGTVNIIREEGEKSLVLSTVETGGCFGELALIACTSRSAAAQATESCLAIRIPRNALQALYERDIEQFLLLQMNMAREVCRRLVDLDELWFRHQLAGPLSD